MKIIIEESAQEYLRKLGYTCLIIDMIPEVTSGGCGCGKTRKFYTPEVRPLNEYKDKNNNYTKVEAADFNVYIMNKAYKAAEDTVTILLEKSLFLKKLQLRGIPIIFEDINK